MLSKKILKKIPIIKRVYPSLMKIFYENEKIKFKFVDTIYNNGKTDYCYKNF